MNILNTFLYIFFLLELYITVTKKTTIIVSSYFNGGNVTKFKQLVPEILEVDQGVHIFDVYVVTALFY